jgi:8-oxo-dGTP diphosphatase
MKQPDPSLDAVLAWCEAVFGPFQMLSDQSKEHAGLRAGAYRIQTSQGPAYIKIHRDPAHWNSEVHAYENWARAFGQYAPTLLAVRDVEPLAVVITALPGQVMEGLHLSRSQEQAAWRAAGLALAGLHELPGEKPSRGYFGACWRNGTCAGDPVLDACDYVRSGFEDLLRREAGTGWLDKGERVVVQSALQRIPAFAGEPPTPCHRDYCAANWLIRADGTWAGVIDFEFSAWDLRAADFTRDPGWHWLSRPDLLDAFFSGYGRSFSDAEEQQRFVAYTQYALVAVVWGMENEYYGFVEEGHLALRRLAELANERRSR